MFTVIIIDETTIVAVAYVSKLTEKLYVITYKHFDNIIYTLSRVFA